MDKIELYVITYVELCFIMTMENIAHCVYYGKYSTLLSLDLNLDGFIQ